MKTFWVSLSCFAFKSVKYNVCFETEQGLLFVIKIIKINGIKLKYECVHVMW